MDDKKRLPDAELAVMQAIWAVGGEVSRGDLDGALLPCAGDAPPGPTRQRLEGLPAALGAEPALAE